MTRCKAATGCVKHASFGFEGGSASYCSEHKLDGMIDVKNKRCAHEGCMKRPHFNAPGSSVGMYCAVHKLAGMVNMKSKRCAHEGCMSQPNFNVPSSSTGI